MPAPARLGSLALGAAVAAGAAGVGLELAGAHSAARSALVLLFLAVAPTAAIAGLMRTLDGFARLIIACTANVVILALTALIMLAEGVWSPTGGLLAVTAFTAACLAAQLPPVRRGLEEQAASWRAAREHRGARTGKADPESGPDPSAAPHPGPADPDAAAALPGQAE